MATNPAFPCPYDEANALAGRMTKLKSPFVRNWDFSHFVVLTRVGARSVTLHDPAVGRRAMPLKGFSKHFAGVPLELLPTACDAATCRTSAPWPKQSPN